VVDIILLVFKYWLYGIPTAFVVFGISAGVDRYSYMPNGMLDVIVGAILWPVVIVLWLIDLWRYR